MERIKGKDIAIYRAQDETSEFELIGLSTSCEVQVSCDMVEFTSFLSAGAKRVRPGRYWWTMSLDKLVAEGDGLLDALREKQRLFVCMSLGLPSGSSHCVRGWAYVAGWGEAAPLSGMATCKATLQGDGVLL